MSNAHQTAIQDAYEALLLSYAAGLLDQAQSLIVASHIALSPQAREKVETCEAIGGALMERNCEPVSMRSESLTNVLRHLDNPQERSEQIDEQIIEIVFPEGLSIPLCLKRTVACHVRQTHWRRLRPGIEGLELTLECRQSRTRFLKAERGVKTPCPPQRGMELTLVLDGALMDETGMYKRGDLVIVDETIHHQPISCERQGGFYMVVSSTPTGGLHRLLNSLFRF
ncbi:MAG: ChrR family anti-sigma-E factor [Alphaproteobacteria bacterium]